MVLKVVVLLVAAAFVAHRLLPRRRMPWMVPIAVVGVVLTIRTVTWLLGD